MMEVLLFVAEIEKSNVLQLQAEGNSATKGRRMLIAVFRYQTHITKSHGFHKDIKFVEIYGNSYCMLL